MNKLTLTEAKNQTENLAGKVYQLNSLFKEMAQQGFSFKIDTETVNALLCDYPTITITPTISPLSIKNAT